MYPFDLGSISVTRHSATQAVAAMADTATFIDLTRRLDEPETINGYAVAFLLREELGVRGWQEFGQLSREQLRQFQQTLPEVHPGVPEQLGSKHRFAPGHLNSLDVLWKDAARSAAELREIRRRASASAGR